eukprot:g5604.t1
MGVLINGKWERDDKNFKMDPSKQAGTFSTPHQNIAVEGGQRYYLYVCDGCPWAARPWMAAAATGLDVEAIRIVRVFPGNSEDGWFFTPVSEQERRTVEEHRECGFQWDRVEPYSKGKFTHLHQIYTAGDPNITGRVTVPLLFDTKTSTCISTESEDLVTVFLDRFAPLHVNPLSSTFYPKGLREEIHRQIKILTKEVNSMVYGIHFAKTQQLFNKKKEMFFASLRRYERILSERSWLLPQQDGPTVLDFVLFATIVRFDCAYGPRFRMTRYTIREHFPSLWSHTCRLWCVVPTLKRAVHFNGILGMYYLSHPLIVKAGNTVGPLLENYEKRLEEGGEHGGSGMRSLGTLVAVFTGGMIVGATLIGYRVKRE